MCFRDGSNTRVIGIGIISILEIPKLDNVLLMDGLKANLLSIC